ncbi:LSU ribosomal protein L15p (L27Ae) [hydrothermal vent metagenome]|uniref:LSU ribosomal protein L15p (L27Ae) n=1 Tax=hydrothermal vent metagenome TaxID=652676 RepID=A0A3B0SQX3_9ZZZZ
MKLHHLRPAEGSKKRKIRVGRGEAGRRGKTAGRGTKGLKARSKVRLGFEGGQTPLLKQMPKLKGFRNPNREEFTVINVERLGAFDTGSTVTPDDMREAGLAKKRGKIKVLGQGDLDVALTVKAHAFSSGAADKIKAAGGTIEVLDDK